MISLFAHMQRLNAAMFEIIAASRENCTAQVYVRKYWQSSV